MGTPAPDCQEGTGHAKTTWQKRFLQCSTSHPIPPRLTRALARLRRKRDMPCIYIYINITHVPSPLGRYLTTTHIDPNNPSYLSIMPASQPHQHYTVPTTSPVTLLRYCSLRPLTSLAPFSSPQKRHQQRSVAISKFPPIITYVYST